MREEIRPIDRLFVRYWVTDRCLPEINFSVHYSSDGSFIYDYM